jgi:DNA invertase Pin-like site-specific DNA recombinase
MKKAVGYMRVSGKGQVKGDGFARQEKAIRDYAKQNGFEIVRIYKERGVSGTFENRPALAEMMYDIEEDPCTIIIERIDRLARDLMIQETILSNVKKSGSDIISADMGEKLDDDPTRKLVRQVLGAIAEYDKTMTVQKLKAARDRKKQKTGKCEGRKSYQESSPELIAEIKRLRRKPKNGKRMSIKKTVEALKIAGFTTATGKEITVSRLENIIYKSIGMGA